MSVGWNLEIVAPCGISPISGGVCYLFHLSAKQVRKVWVPLFLADWVLDYWQVASIYSDTPESRGFRKSESKSVSSSSCDVNVCLIHTFAPCWSESCDGQFILRNDTDSSISTHFERNLWNWQTLGHKPLFSVTFFYIQYLCVIDFSVRIFSDF